MSRFSRQGSLILVGSRNTQAAPPAVDLRQEAAGRSFGRNLAAMVTFDMVWNLGAPCCAAGVMLPAYLLYFGQSRATVQLAMAGLTMMGFLQVFSGRLSHTNRRNRLLVLWAMLCVCWMAMGAIGLASKHLGPQVNLPLLMVLLCMGAALMSSLANPGYWELTLDMTPRHRRGLTASIRTLFGGLCGLAGAVLVAWLMTSTKAPKNFHACFLIGSCLMALSCLSMLGMRDPGPAIAHRPSMGSALRKMLSHRPFLVFLLFYAMLACAQSLAPLLIAYGKDAAAMSAADTGRFTIVSLVGSIIVGTAVPLLADQFGFRLMAIINALVLCAAWVMPMLLPASPRVVLGSYMCICGSAALTPYVLANLGQEILPRVRPAMTIALSAVLVAPITLTTGPLLGWVVDNGMAARNAHGAGGAYRAVFIAAMSLSVAALAGFNLLVKEPRSKTA